MLTPAGLGIRDKMLRPGREDRAVTEGEFLGAPAHALANAANGEATFIHHVRTDAEGRRLPGSIVFAVVVPAARYQAMREALRSDADRRLDDALARNPRIEAK